MRLKNNLYRGDELRACYVPLQIVKLWMICVLYLFTDTAHGIKVRKDNT